MGTTLKEDVFTGSNNSFTLNLTTSDGNPVAMDSITSMKLWLGRECSYEISSEVFPNAFNWLTPTHAAIGDTEFSLGDAALQLAVPPGSYDTRWKVFAPFIPEGVIVLDKSSKVVKLVVRVLASCETA